MEEDISHTIVCGSLPYNFLTSSFPPHPLPPPPLKQKIPFICCLCDEIQLCSCSSLAAGAEILSTLSCITLLPHVLEFLKTQSQGCWHSLFYRWASRGLRKGGFVWGIREWLSQSVLGSNLFWNASPCADFDFPGSRPSGRRLESLGTKRPKKPLFWISLCFLVLW